MGLQRQSQTSAEEGANRELSDNALSLAHCSLPISVELYGITRHGSSGQKPAQARF